MTDLTSLLLATQDPTKRANAEECIKQAEQSNAEQYFIALAQELANNEKPPIARQLSGILLKNGLAAKDPASAKSEALKKRWASFPEASRDLVKQATTSALITENLDVGKAAAQVLAKIGSIEIPENAWPGLVPLLLQHVTNTSQDSQGIRARQIALVTLNYLCDDLVGIKEDGGVVNDDIANQVLTAVAQGMRDNDMNTKLEATRAFYHAVVLAEKNFRNGAERNFIMRVVTDTCKTAGSEQVQIAAFECLVQIATWYYDFILPYMEDVGPMTWETIKSSSEKVAIPAMEFWSTICDEELYLKDLEQAGQAGDRRCLNIISMAIQYLVPLLTQTLTKQQSEEDDDTWNLAMAAGTCLTLVAQVVGDQCVDPVVAFVHANFTNADWKYREAAILAYGSIMEGPTSAKMQPLVMQSYQPLVMALQDPSVAVRDTLAWTLGRIAQFHPTIVPVRELTPVLGQALAQQPRVAANICWVIQVMAEAQQQGQQTTVLSEFFMFLCQALVEVTTRRDANERRLRMSAYNALSTVVAHSGNDCLQYMDKLAEEMLNHLAASFKEPVDSECELQGLICGVLTALVYRIRDKITPAAANRVMEEALKVIAAYQQVKGGAKVLQEEALLLVISVINSVGPQFSGFMTHFFPHLKVGLENYEDVPVCVMAVGGVGDLCRALESKITGYCDVILEILHNHLLNPNVDKKIKSAIMTCFGDIAMGISGSFEKYLPIVMRLLQEASNTKITDVQTPNEEWIEYLNNLHEGVLEAYSGIIHGLKEAGKLQLFKGHVNQLLAFITMICESQTVSDPVKKAAVGVVGDLIQAFKEELTQHLRDVPLIVKLVEFAARSNDPSTQRVGSWMQQMIQRYGGGM